MTLAYLISIGIPLLILLVMLIFRLYSRRNLGWMAFCLLWGAFGCFLSTQINGYLYAQGVAMNTLVIFLAPIVHQLVVSGGVFFYSTARNPTI